MTNEFEVGQVLEAIILRVINKTHFVVSIQGTFYLIDNQTLEDFRPGSTVKLIVDSTIPLRMKLHKQTSHGHIHFHI